MFLNSIGFIIVNIDFRINIIVFTVLGAPLLEIKD